MATAFVSDGGSSDYYKLTITNRETGATFPCEMGDVIASIYGNDFDMGNIAKAMRRIHCIRRGGGKAGTSEKYDAKKVVYFGNVLIQTAIQNERNVAVLPGGGIAHLMPIQFGTPSDAAFNAIGGPL